MAEDRETPESDPDPAADGADDTPAADGDEDTPAADGDEDTPAADGDEDTPAADGTDDAPAADGADDAPATDGTDDGEDGPVGGATDGDAAETAPTENDTASPAAAGSGTADGDDDARPDASRAHGEASDGDAALGDGTTPGEDATVGGTPPTGDGAPVTPEGPAVTDGATVGTESEPVSTPGAGEGPAVEDDPFVDADVDRTGPEEDVEMPLADHIEEMVRRLGIVFLVGGVVTLAVFPMADQTINYLWNAHIPGAATIADRRPRLYGPLELVLTELKVAGLAGLVAGLPVLVYQSYRFMRPGLYPKERRYYLAAVPTSLVLAFVGVAFAHFVVLPAIFAYFTAYTTGTALVAFGLRETFNLILLLMGYMAIVFQIPLFIELGIMMGLVTRGWLEDKRLLFWGAFAGISFLVTPDPTGMAPIIIIVTMISLYEGTLALLRWTGN